MSRVVIIGGGVGGLAAANLLAHEGHEVHVYEKNARFGGRAGILEEDGFRFDTGPSWYLMPEVFARYYQRLGLDVERELSIEKLHPAYKVFYESADPIVITGDLETDAQTFESIERGAGAKLKKYVTQSRQIYDIALDNFLYTSFTPRELKNLFRPEIIRATPQLLNMTRQSVHDRVGRNFADQRLQQILEYTTVFLGASPYETPALYTLMAALDFHDGVYYLRGGIYTLIENLMQVGMGLGVSYHPSSAVSAILSNGSTATGIRLEDGSEIVADIVISNADMYHTETALLSEANRSYSDRYWQRLNPGPGALLLYLGVKGELPQLEHHDLYFVEQWQDNFDAIYNSQTIPDHASLYISRTSATDPTVAPDGHEAVVVLVPFPPNCELSMEDADRLADKYIEIIARKIQVPELAERIVYREIRLPQSYASEFNSWQSSALGPAHILRQSALFRSRNRSKKLRNLYFTGGTTIPGIGLPMCVISAELVAERIARDA